jgi:aminoglycoside phosphotransferase (APT) family kinase protein
MANVLGIDEAGVGRWLEEHVPGAQAPFDYDLIAGGHSNLTYRVTDATGHRYVLRRPPLGPLLASAHDMRREHRIIAGLQSSAVPVPPAIGLCEDTAVNGAPFYVMGFVDGHVIRDRFDAESALPPEARRAAGHSLVDTLAAIHAVDLRAAGLDGLGRHDGYIARQLKRWYGQWNQQKTRELPSVDRVHDQLHACIPPQGPATIVHGDYRLDNAMVDSDGRVVAVLDWEICTLGDPLADLGLLFVYWTGPDDEPSAWAGSATTAAGFPNRDELLERYASVSGRSLDGVDFYVAFAFWKLACILEGVYARYVAGQKGHVDHAEIEAFRAQVDRAAEQADRYAGLLT